MEVPVDGSPAVTAVIPTHNRPELMQRAVRSVLSQEYDGPIEALVVFDACDAFEPTVDVSPCRTVRTVVNHRTRGLAGARNTGIVEASHGFVAFLDDDDRWLPGKLMAQMAVFEREPDAVLVGTAMVVDDGRVTHERLVPIDRVHHRDLLRDRLAGLHSSSFVFRKGALTGPVGLVDENLPGSYGEDWDLLLRTAEVGAVHVVNRPLVAVSWSGQSYFLGRWSAYAEGLQYLLAAHPGFRADRRAYGRLTGKIAFACAAAGDRGPALGWVRRSLSHVPTQRKAWLALAISLRLLSAPWVVRVAQRLGRGV